MKRKVISILLIIVVLQGMLYGVFATSTDDLNDQKSDLNAKINETKEQQAEVKEQLNNQLEEISSLDQKIEESENEINDLENQISSLEDSIAEKTKELEKKQKEYEENEVLLDERLNVMYETGETSFLDILFNSKNIVDFISNYYTLSQLAECDTELLQSIENEKAQIEETKSTLESQKTELDSAKSSKEAKANTLKNTKTQRQEKVNALSEENKKLQSDIDSYNSQVAKVESQIQEALRKAQEEINKANGSSSGSSGLKFDGSFIWPCNNKIVTSTVKIRWGRWHKGIDIGASYENVYAAASGYAYTMENPGGYGHYMMVVHGDGYITLYGHLNSYNVSSGTYVKQGQVIAKSGNSGSSQGAHLHFEIRKTSSLSSYFSSSFLNPLDYLPGGYTLAAGASTPS